MSTPGDLERAAPGHQKKPNPQGKGMVPILRDWATVQPGKGVSKAPAMFLRDYCISSLVLAANFRFKPVLGKGYFLYVRDNEWIMSLIAPHEWGRTQPGAFLGRCLLRGDMTWEIQTPQAGEADEVALARAQDFIQGFVEAVAGQEAIGEHLPFYVSELPYYQRLLGTALAASLQRSIPSGGKGLREALDNPRDWLLCATPEETPLSDDGVTLQHQ